MIPFFERFAGDRRSGCLEHPATIALVRAPIYNLSRLFNKGKAPSSHATDFAASHRSLPPHPKIARLIS
jgi:hypothetical protein